VIAMRKARGQSQKSGSEIYSRAAKTLLAAGKEPVRDQALGLRLELVRTGDAFQVLFEGKPLADALVIALRRGAADKPLRVRSDRNGRAAFPAFAGGEWLVKTVHMVPAPQSAGADWESIWASETFRVP